MNVTPLTDLILAIASMQSPADWYESDDWKAVATLLEAAQEKLRDALVDAGYDVPEGDPFTSEFSANESDPWDQVLEDLKAAIEADPEIDHYGDLIDRLKTGEVFDRLSCCGRVDVRATFDLNGDGNGTDRLELFANAAGALNGLVYPTGASSNADVGVIVADISNLPTHDQTAFPEDDRVAGTVGESLISIPVDTEPGATTSTNLTITASLVDTSVLQQRWNLRLETATAIQAGQTYSCHEDKTTAGGRKTVRLDAKTASGNTNDYSIQYGGRCQITITDVVIGGPTNSSIESITGRFVAELYPFKRNSTPVVIDDGVFRWTP